MQDMFYFDEGDCIPLRHAHIIKNNFKAGKVWNICSPVFKLTRKQVVQIVTKLTKDK